MRIGTNPAKYEKVQIDTVYHRIVVPVYIPNLEGFFKESFEVLKICLKSLYTTIHSQTKISVASNGSCKIVNDYLALEFEEGRIDEIYQVKSGIGKINSLYKIINSVKEPIVTLTDADVLFSSGWQKDVEQLFLEYPKTGMVCPFSYSKGFRELTANVYFDNFFNKNIKIDKINNPEALKHFANSIGNDMFYKDIHLKYGITFQKKGKSKALIGAGHFVATFRKPVFQHYKFNENLNRLASGEGQYIDLPPIEFGLWRLSTYKNYVFHMGNTILPMYLDVVSNNKNDVAQNFNNLPTIKRESKLMFYVKNKVFSRFIFSNKIFLRYLINKGFTKTQAKEFLNIEN